MELSRHFVEMLRERGIRTEWVEQTRTGPERVENHDDGTRHYLRRISNHGERWLRVVVNPVADPERGVTAFFDRRLKRKSYESQS